MTLIEGRQNQIRLMVRRLGFLVEKLKRLQIGFLRLGTLQAGEYRYLTEQEVARFQRMTRGGK